MTDISIKELLSPSPNPNTIIEKNNTKTNQERFGSIMSLRNKRQGEQIQNKFADIATVESGTSFGIAIYISFLYVGKFQPWQEPPKVKIATPSDNIKNLPKPNGTKQDGLFIASDEELSELENFVSLEDLVRQGGEAARRAEYILDSFGKAPNEEIVAMPSTPKRTRKQPNLVQRVAIYNQGRAPPPIPSQSMYKRLGSSRTHKRI